MKTVFVGAHEDPNGINSYTYNLALELTTRGFKSMVMAFGSCDKTSEYKGVSIKQYKASGSTITSLPSLYFKAIPFLVKHRKEIDVVMYQTVTYSVIPAFIVRLFGMKTCAIIHSLPEDSPKHSDFQKTIMKASMRLALLFTRNLLTVSQSKATEVKTRYGRDCEILPCGVFMPDDNEVQNEEVLALHSISKGRYFLSIGRIDPIKNLDVMIEAFIAHKHEGFQLVLCGDVNNDYGKTIVEKAASCKDIIFPGIVSGNAKASLLKNCMAYCLVSSSEGLPIALLEGMMYGKIPIVTRIPAIEEVLNKNNCGVWNDVYNVEHLANSMEYVENNPEEALHQGIIARQIVKEYYTWPKTCDKYLELAKTF